MTAAARHSRLLVTLLCTAQFLVVLDMTIVNVALPTLQADLGLEPQSAHWVMTAYAVTFGGFLLVGGRAGDAFGRGRVLCAGAALFTIASLACGLAPSAAVLVTARAAQGLGGALLSTAGFGILVATFAAGRGRTQAIATWGSIGSLGAVSGFVAGGLLTEAFGWRAVFLATVPVGCAFLLLAPRLVPQQRARGGKVDVLGAMLATAGIASLAFVVSNGSSAGWSGVPLLAAAVGAAACLCAFASRERRSKTPLIPVGLVRDRSFAAASAVGVAYGSTVLAALVLLAQYLQSARGLTALEAGALMLLLRAPAVGWARVAGRLGGRFGPQPLLVTGTALLASGAVLLSRLEADGSLAQLAPGLLVLGAGIPCLGVAVSASALQTVRADDAGVGSGLITSFQWVGGSLGFAFVSAVAGGAEAPPSLSAEAVVAAIDNGFLACAALCTTALVVAVAALTTPRPSTTRVPT